MVREVQWLQTRRVSNVTIRAVSKLAKLGFRVEGFQNNELQMNLSELLSGLATEETINECARQGFRTLEEECGPLIGARLEAWTDQRLAATFTRECLDPGRVLYNAAADNWYPHPQPLDITARTWSAGWEDRAKAGAFVAAIAYRKGAAVALVGLKTQELNGQSGVVVKELSAATGRIGVKLASRRVVAVKPANLSRT